VLRARVFLSVSSGELRAGRCARAASHCPTTATTGEWDILICRVPVSKKPIMARAPISMKIVINWLLRSLILGNA
jgi:hypothetical protein